MIFIQAGLPNPCHGWHDIQRNPLQMKRILAIIILIAAGCSDHQNNRADASHHSKAESAITDLVDSFKSDYTSASSATAKDAVMAGYHTKTDHFLIKHPLDHMRVHVDSVVIKDLTIDTRFHAGNNLVIWSSMEFRKHMPRLEDSLYQFMKSLRPGTDTNIDFMYIGKFELHRPDDTPHPALIVNAYPLSYQVHGH
jgi:hypothetical protein